MNDFAVIFDMDGVIVNSEPLHQECEREIFQDLDIVLSQEEHDRFLGVSGSDMWKQIIDRFDLKESVEHLIEIQNDCFIKKLESSKPLPIIKGVKTLIQSLSENQIVIMLASSSSQRLVSEVLRLSKLNNYFTYVISGSEVTNSKPSPDIFFKAAMAGGINPDKCVVIEDSENGITAAKRAGMKVIGFLNGFNAEESVSNADLIVSDFSEISLRVLNDLQS